MDLQVENLETHEARIIITLTEEALAQARREVARRISKQVRVPGFRPGNAPINVVIGAVGEQAFANELADELGSKYYATAIDESKVEPYGPGQLEDIKTTPPQLVVRVPLEPTVDLKDYRAIRVPYVAPEVTEADVDQQLEYVRDDNAIVTLQERPAQLGDLIESDVEVEAEGKEVLHNHRPIVLEDSKVGLPGLADAIVGMSAGEHKVTTVTLPEDIADETLRGKPATATIDVKRVSSRQLPEINDELAQTVGSFNTLAELREDLRQRLVEYRTRNAEQQYQTQVLDTFTSLSQIAYPPIYVEDRLNEMIEELKKEVQRDERMPFDEWLKVQSKTEEQLRTEMRPNAENRAKRGLVMRQVAQAEKLTVTDGEIAAEVERTITQYGSASSPELRRSLMRADNVSAIQNTILTNKVLRHIAQIARGESTEPQVDAATVSTEPAPGEPETQQSAGTEASS
ncbi:MAG TPA: trigger factor [Anaerolineae bacterium]